MYFKYLKNGQNNNAIFPDQISKSLDKNDRAVFEASYTLMEISVIRIACNFITLHRYPTLVQLLNLLSQLRSSFRQHRCVTYLYHIPVCSFHYAIKGLCCLFLNNYRISKIPQNKAYYFCECFNTRKQFTINIKTMAGILDLVGNTPLVELKKVTVNKKVKIYGKLEGNNPGGSVKDRAAYGMIKGAIDRGEITDGIKLIEATSGNTGIALAMIASLFGIKIELVMPEDATRERVLTMEAFGAKVILTPKANSMEGAIDYANEQMTKGGYLMLNQFSNPDNPGMHYKTTGPEIWNDTDGKITHFVSSMGTTGTIMGVSKYLKEVDPNVQIVGCQPTDGSRIPGIRKWPEAYLPKIFDRSRIDRVIELDEKDARLMARRLAREEAIFSGMSSGGAAHTAIELSKELEEGVIVFIVCDRGDRYLSSDLFD